MSHQMNQFCTFSVVIPIYNEAENIEPLFHELKAVMNELAKPWEVIFVDDGSKDTSVAIIENLKKSNDAIVLIRFKKNAGQTAAFDAGFKAAKGNFVITLDGDGQNCPYDIPKLVAIAETGYDLVAGKRRVRNDSIIKRSISRAANSIRSKILHDNVTDTGCSLKVYRKESLAQIRLYKGMHRFLPALFAIEGFKVIEVVVDHRPRLKGVSKYGIFNRGLSLLTDLWAVLWMKRRHLYYEVEK
ncbi:MAG TPA: glycosyltransferase family 2 protein [Chlamydiales bacterium]|nr:glycosyltransferase family 2 protein [Chlamydiales bacterium]